jgi:sigma-B regulation protein RsbU (phosphoserine phosphatase)
MGCTRRAPCRSEISVAKPGTRHLKLYTEQPPEAFRPGLETLGPLTDVLEAFRRTTGWSLRYVAGPDPTPVSDLTWSAPVNPGVGVPLGHLRLDPGAAGPAGPSLPVDPADPRELATALAGMFGELMRTRHALWQREAELATGVPLVAHPDQPQHLAVRLQAVLQGGAEAVGCHAAALYLLDEATTQLKLRSSWGLPPDRMTAPARPLRGAVADLEALLGHAVVLSNPELMRHWKVPESFPAAVCVPVSTPTSLLGTLWVFCHQSRDFDDRQTSIVEVVAGRLAADLHCEILLREGLDAARWKRQLSAAEQLQQSQLPTISPLLRNWDLAGWTLQSEPVGGDFYDWFCLPDGLLAVAVGDAMDRGLRAAMAASALKAALRAHGQYHRQAEQALKRINLTLWTGSAGDQKTTLFYGLIQTATGRISCCWAGQPGIVLLGKNGWKSLSHPSPPLGEGPETDYPQFACELQPGEALLAFTDGFRDATDAEGRPLGEAGVAEPLLAHLGLSADQLVDLARKTLNTHAAAADRDDRTVLVVKRTQT